MSTPEPAPIVATQLTVPSTTSRSTRFIRALDRPDAPQRRIFKTPSRLERQGPGAVSTHPGKEARDVIPCCKEEETRHHGESRSICPFLCCRRQWPPPTQRLDDIEEQMAPVEDGNRQQVHDPHSHRKDRSQAQE